MRFIIISEQATVRRGQFLERARGGHEEWVPSIETCLCDTCGFAVASDLPLLTGHCVNGVAVQFDNRSVLGFQLQVPNAEAQRWLGRRERGHLLNFTAPSPDHVLQGVDACRTGNTLCGLNFDFAHGCPRPSDSAIQCCHGACQSVLYPAAGVRRRCAGRWRTTVRRRRVSGSLRISAN